MSLGPREALDVDVDDAGVAGIDGERLVFRQQDGPVAKIEDVRPGRPTDGPDQDGLAGAAGLARPDIHRDGGADADDQAADTEMVARAVYSGAAIRYAADNCMHYVEFDEYEAWDAIHAKQHHGWRPSTHMPRWASRIARTVTRVYALRVSDLNDDELRGMGTTEPGNVEAAHRALFDLYWSQDWPPQPHYLDPAGLNEWAWIYEVTQ